MRPAAGNTTAHGRRARRRWCRAVPRLFWNSIDSVVHEAVYGQVNVHFTDKWTLMLEARQNKDDNEQNRSTGLNFGVTAPTATNPVPCQGNIEGQIFYCPQPGYPPLTPGVPGWTFNGPLIAKDNLPTYKVGVNWEPAKGQFLYAFTARGYKAAQSVAPGFAPITEELVDDVEIGWKGTLRPGLYAEFGIFDMSYQDMQLSVFQTTAERGNQVVSNIGESSISGWEGSLRAVVGRFGINANVASTDSSLGDISTVDTRFLPPLPPGQQDQPGDTSKGCTPAISATGACVDYTPYRLSFTGAENPFSPKMTYTLGFDYTVELKGGGTLTPSVSYNYSDSAYASLLQRTDDNYYRTDPRKLANLSLSYKKDNWDVQFYSTNVTDQLFIEGVNAGSSVLYGDPRVTGIRMRMKF